MTAAEAIARANDDDEARRAYAAALAEVPPDDVESIAALRRAFVERRRADSAKPRQRVRSVAEEGPVAAEEQTGEGLFHWLFRTRPWVGWVIAALLVLALLVGVLA